MAERLSAAEVEGFLRQIGIDTSKHSERDRLAFMNTLIVAFGQHEPFTNLQIQATEKSVRRPRTWEENKRLMLTFQGGVCADMNRFMCALLSSLGFEAYSTMSSVSYGGHVDPNKTHVVTIVQSVVDEGDVFMVDVGFGSPDMSAIPLDFDVESPVYYHCHVTCKYTNQRGVYTRKRLHSDHDTWDTDYSFELKPYSTAEIDAVQGFWVHRYESGHKSTQDNLRAVINPPGKSCAFKITKDEVTVFEATSSDRKYNTRDLSSLSELKSFVDQYFPRMPWDTIEKVAYLYTE